MQLLLSQYVYCCDVGDGVVFLDLKREKYMGLSSGASALLGSVVSGWPLAPMTACDDGSRSANGIELANSLVEQGILTYSSVHGKPATPASVQRRRAIEYEHESNTTNCSASSTFRFRHALQLLLAYLTVQFEMHVLPFEKLVRRLQFEQARAAFKTQRCDDVATITALVKSFRRLRSLFYTAHDKCVFDSLVLMEFLRKYGIRTTMVIGVDTRPFSAHCWLQHGDLVLTDSLERARQFCPILVV